MEIKHKVTESKGAFEMYENDQKIAEMTYSRAGVEKIIIDHTEVDSAHGGKGLGKILINEAVEYARKEHLKIIPLCPFANKVLRYSEGYSDILAL